MSNLYAVVNKETTLVTNMIVWDGADPSIIPATEEWVYIPDSMQPKPTMGWTYVNGEFVPPPPPPPEPVTV